MSEALLGPLPFDIHGGGLDLIFPHHENEIAQSCCARDVDRMARFWLHNGFVDMRGEKMAKSVGNVVRVDEVLARVPGEAVRLWMLGTHYRQPIDYADEALAEAKRTLDRLYRALESTGSPQATDPDREVVAALADDLNTPAALKRLHVLLGKLNTAEDESLKREVASRLRASAEVMGLLGSEDWFGRRASDVERIRSRIEERAAARRERNFARADAIRAELEAEGIVLMDRRDGSTDWDRVRNPR
jgi:cysteinyl-tRNA synthetase